MRNYAADLRQKATQPERALWYWLRGRRLNGLKFRRQAVLGASIVDFLCPEIKLIVEIDGESHVGCGVKDQLRDAALHKDGYRIVRVTNDEVLTNIEGVLAFVQRAASEIRSEMQSHTPPTPWPPPSREGGTSTCR